LRGTAQQNDAEQSAGQRGAGAVLAARRGASRKSGIGDPGAQSRRKQLPVHVPLPSEPQAAVESATSI
jgi:hypothetical protein